MKLRPPIYNPEQGCTRGRRKPSRCAFTLLELLVVIAIMAILSVLVLPAFTKRKTAADLTNAAYTITGVLEQARNYAMANNTYVWVGFYEENITAAAPTNATPPYPGVGRLLIATVASKDGTKLLDDSDASAPLPATYLNQLGKLIKIEGLHITEIGAPPSPTPSPTPSPDSLDGRPNGPYADGSPFDHYNRISSDNPSGKQVNGDQTQFPFSAQNYTFYKTVRFSPRGEANLNGTYAYKHVAEIGLRPTHAITVDVKNKNVVAIQFGALEGNFKIYRK